jgi:Protein of unknown function (DUF3443)
MKPRNLMMLAIVAAALATLTTAGPVFATAANVLNVNVNHGPNSMGVDQPYGHATVCVPGTNTCQRIGGLLIDTGSYGLRIFSQALTITLPAQTSGPDKIAECVFFGSFTTWGKVATADVKLAGEPTISNLPVQVINPNFPSVGSRPARCEDGTPIAQNPQQLNFNGILGVGLVQSDCPVCVSSTPAHRGYYACTSTNCTRTTEPLDLQVQNPVALLPVDNNGVLLNLPLPPANGAASLAGVLVFGINTEPNNQLLTPPFKVYTADPAFLTFTTRFHNTPIGFSFIDSGSNSFFYDNPSLPVCPGIAAPWYCPAALTAQHATTIGSDGMNSTVVNFDIANAEGLFLTGNAAFFDLGANLGSGMVFDWGLPFFLGRKVFVGIAGKSIAGVTESTPLWAYK